MFFKVITAIIVVIVTIFVLAIQTPDPDGESDGIAIPLTKRSETDVREFHATSLHTNGKIIRDPSGMNGSEPSVVQRDGLGTGLELTKIGNGIWLGTISIGIPSKPFTVQFNTAFSDLFVPASTGDENCRSHGNLWDPASYQTTDTDIDMGFAITLADGRAASGKQYVDTVTIAGFTADSQTIGVATTCSSSLAANVFPPDGILGLGFPSVAQLHFQSPLFHTLFNEGKLLQPVFSLTFTASGGELYVGGTNRALYVQRTLVWTPVTSPFSWQLMITDIRINGMIVLRDVPAVIDTGGNFIYGDIQRVMTLHGAAGGRPYQDSIGFYTFPCASFPSVTFTIAERPITMIPGVLNKGRVKRRSPKCFSGILAKHQQPTEPWLLGTIFLQQLYTVFDFNSQSPRIGFARLRVAA